MSDTEETTQTEQTQLNAIEWLGHDLMAIVLDEMKAMPDVWQKLPEFEQGDVIDRVRERVTEAAGKAIALISSNGCMKVSGVLESVQIKDKIKAVLIVDRTNQSDALQELYESAAQPCLIVMATPDAVLGGMDQIQADPDQHDLELDDEAA
ncbi:hypothetical protein [Hahella ganghwensis]|uniref:hypothetical protein n=1 Tax=Hahella ganghwensis TaxID=286420 RepID=UPI00036D0625|nr:hypothetical protein [Hahella ganghwensis]